MGLTYDGAVDEGSVLRRSVGRRVVFRLPESKDTLSALVLGVDPLRLQLPDGRVTFTPPGAALYPGDVVVADPTLNLQLQSDRAQDKLRLGYFTEGASWLASYQIMLGRATPAWPAARCSSHRRSGRRMPKSSSWPARWDARTSRRRRGRTRRASPSRRRGDGQGPDRERAARGRVPPLLAARPHDAPAWPRRHDRAVRAGGREVRAHVRGAGMVPWWGFLPQQGDETEAPVEVFYTLKRARKTDFGDRPLPGGRARLFQPDSAGRAQLVGEARVEHTPAGEDLRLSAGTAFDLTARRVQTSYVTRRDSSAAGIRTLATADYKVTVRNATDSAATVEVREERAGEWSVLQEQRAGGEGVLHHHPLPGEGAGARRDACSPTASGSSGEGPAGPCSLQAMTAPITIIAPVGPPLRRVRGPRADRGARGLHPHPRRRRHRRLGRPDPARPPRRVPGGACVHPAAAGAPPRAGGSRQPRHRMVEEPARPDGAVGEVLQVLPLFPRPHAGAGDSGRHDRGRAQQLRRGLRVADLEPERHRGEGASAGVGDHPGREDLRHRSAGGGPHPHLPSQHPAGWRSPGGWGSPTGGRPTAGCSPPAPT